jgi:hypothetical protein
VILRRALLAMAAFCMSHTAACAQDGSIMGQTWQYFLDRCGLAYSDQKRYLEEISAGRTASAGTIARTPDGRVLWTGTTGTVLHDTYTYTIVGSRRVQNCYAMGFFDGSPVGSPKIAEQFTQLMATRPELAVSGGLTPETTGLPGMDTNTYRYAVLGALPDEIVARVIVGPGVVEIFSTHIDDGN